MALRLLPSSLSFGSRADVAISRWRLQKSLSLTIKLSLRQGLVRTDAPSNGSSPSIFDPDVRSLPSTFKRKESEGRNSVATYQLRLLHARGF